MAKSREELISALNVTIPELPNIEDVLGYKGAETANSDFVTEFGQKYASDPNWAYGPKADKTAKKVQKPKK